MSSILSKVYICATCADATRENFTEEAAKDHMRVLAHAVLYGAGDDHICDDADDQPLAGSCDCGGHSEGSDDEGEYDPW